MTPETTIAAMPRRYVLVATHGDPPKIAPAMSAMNGVFAEHGMNDRHAAVALVLDGARRHDARHAASGPHKNRDEALAGQPEFAEKPVQHERDPRHVPARLDPREQEEEHEHLRHEPEHRADPGDDAVQHQTAHPRRAVHPVEQRFDDLRHAGDPPAVIGGVGSGELVPDQNGDRFGEIFSGDFDLLARQRLLVDLAVRRSLLRRHGPRERGKRLLRRRRVEILRLGIELLHERHGRERRHRVPGRGKGFGSRLVIPRADAEKMETVAEQPVVRPVGRHLPDRDHGDVIDEEHHRGENRQPEPAAGDDAVDLVRRGQFAGVLLPVTGGDDVVDGGVPLADDDGFGVVAQFPLRRGDVFLDMGERLGGDLHLLQDLFVALEDLDRVPALFFRRQMVQHGLLDMRDGMFDRAGKVVHREPLPLRSGGDRGFGGLLHALALERGDLHHGRPEPAGKFREIDLIAVLAHDVHHVDGDHHRDPEFGQLGGEVEIAFEVGAVDDVQDGLRRLVDEIIPGDDLLLRIRRKRVNSRQIGDDDVFVFPETPLLFFDRDAGPVSNVLIGSREGIEERGFATVRIARERDADRLSVCHDLKPPVYCTSMISTSSRRRLSS